MKHNCYFDTKNEKDCNGCGACVLRCPVHAISFRENHEGFFYPVIDDKKCIQCGLCKRVCSNMNPTLNIPKKAYMVINQNKIELKRSASGGIFFLLAKYVIQNQGFVYGVTYDTYLKVKHDKASTIEECQKFQGSKYVRSDLKNTYPDIEQRLKEGKLVLFTGTPCQCQGLKKYLKKEYENLIVCDIICHANPSQKLFDLYIQSIEKRVHKKVKKIDFRSKVNGWNNSTPILFFEDGTQMEEDTFYRAFSRELIDRPSCHSCQFSTIKRGTDLTIGDFWGVEKILPDFCQFTNEGVSILLINTKKGQELFDHLTEEMYYKEITVDDAFKWNHHGNLKMHRNREKFFEKLEEMDIIDNINHCLQPPIYKKILKKMFKLK